MKGGGSRTDVLHGVETLSRPQLTGTKRACSEVVADLRLFCFILNDLRGGMTGKSKILFG